MEKRERNSSIELLRVITIIWIIFHHFNVHGVWEMQDTVFPGWQLFVSGMTGWGGGVGNDIFMIITGYFMITGKVHWKRVVMLLFTMFFYSWIIAGFFYGVIGWPLTAKEISKYAVPIWSGVNWFVGCYIVFVCFVPFVNLFIQKMTERQYVSFMILFYIMFRVIPRFSGETYLSGGLVQFFIMYLLGAYIRLYGNEIKHFHNMKFWRRCFLGSLLFIGIASVVPSVFGHWGPYNKIAYLISPFMAVICFMLALCHKPFSSKIINGMAGSVLGIYLIHDNPLVRKFIWTVWSPNLDYLDTWYFPLFMIGKVALVFLVCLGIDQLRLHFVEPYMKRYVDAQWPKWERKLDACKVRMNQYLTKI